MGNVTPSVDLNMPASMKISYFSIQMGYTDRLRLVLAPNDVVDATQSVLSLTWPIQDIKKTTGFVEFKLAGRPWYTVGEENLNVKYFMCSLLQRFYALGWHLKASSDMQRAGSDTNVLFFHKLIPKSTSVICLSLNSTDKIRVLGPESVFSLVKNTVLGSWPLGIQREQMFGQSYEIKLHGNPWTDWARDSLESFAIPIMICEIMSTFFKNGWLFAGAIDTGKTQHSLNALYFYYAPNEMNQSDSANTKFFALSLNKNDRIRLHRATPDLISIMSNTSWGIPQLWRAGIQQQSIIHNALEFKLKGNPWYANEHEAVESRRLLNNIFNLLARYGWNLYGTCDLTKNLSNKSTFFFRSKPIDPKSLVNFCVSLNETDKIRLIDHNPGLEQQVRMAIMQAWPKGIQMESDYFSSRQFKLKGYPWQNFDSSADHVYAIVLMIFILQNIESLGFRLLCSADVSGKYVSNDDNSYPVDLHSWFFEN